MNKTDHIISNAKYSIGQLVLHKLFNYRGVIVDIDPNFQLTDEWYEAVAQSRPPKNEPWYHVLVHNAIHATYVAEQNLSPDLSGEEIKNPMVKVVFTELKNGQYINGEKIN